MSRDDFPPPPLPRLLQPGVEGCVLLYTHMIVPTSACFLAIESPQNECMVPAQRRLQKICPFFTSHRRPIYTQFAAYLKYGQAFTRRQAVHSSSPVLPCPARILSLTQICRQPSQHHHVHSLARRLVHLDVSTSGPRRRTKEDAKDVAAHGSRRT